MKPIIFTIIMAGCLMNTFAQTATVQRLYNEIKNAGEVEGRYLGCFGYQSPLWKKADSLKKAVGPPTFVRYFNDSSVNLKYYAFVVQLASNDDTAFDMIKNTNLSDSINFEYAGQFYGHVKLVELFMGIYLVAIKLRYYYNGGTWDLQQFYGAKNRKTWKRKQAIATKFIADNNLSQEWITAISH